MKSFSHNSLEKCYTKWNVLDVWNVLSNHAIPYKGSFIFIRKQLKLPFSKKAILGNMCYLNYQENAAS